MATTLEQILTFIRAEASVADDDPDFGPAVDLFDLGYLDSFSLVRFIAWADESFGIDLGNADFFNDLRSATRIAEAVDARRAPR